MTSTTASAPQRVDEIDALRFIAVCFVVALHTFSTPGVATVTTAALIDGLCRFAVPCFFMISGWLAPQTLVDPVGYLVRVLGRLAPIFLAWTLVYLAADAAGLPITSAGSVWHLQPPAYQLWQTLQGNGLAYQLWFLPSLFFSLTAFVLLRAIIGRTGVLVVAIALFVSGLALGPYNEPTGLDAVLEWMHTAPENVTGRDGIAFGLLFIVLGNRLAAAPVRPSSWLIPAVCAGYLLQEVEFITLTSLSQRGRALTIDYGIGTLVFALAAFRLAIATRLGGTGARLAWLGRHALGVFCIHVLLLEAIRNLLWPDLGYSGATAFLSRLALMTSVIVLSTGAAIALARLSWSRRLVQ